jgi:transcriptional regulator with PAS, ATPase and Fis domain
VDNLEKIRILHESLFGDFSANNIIDVLPICIHEIDLDGKLTKMNNAGLCMLDQSESEVVGSDYLSYVSKEDLPRISDLLYAAIKDGETKKFKFKTSNGNTYYSCFAPIIKNDKVIKIVGYTQESEKWTI